MIFRLNELYDFWGIIIRSRNATVLTNAGHKREAHDCAKSQKNEKLNKILHTTPIRSFRQKNKGSRNLRSY